MTRFGDPGVGPLLAAGTFDLAGGVPAAKIARWNGQAWTALGAGISAAEGDSFPPVIQALAPFGGALYAGGSFSRAGSVDMNSIARWDGTDWSMVGGGIGIGGGGRRPAVTALAVFDDGQGPALYAAGILDVAGGPPVRNIAKWDGAAWSALGAGVGSGVNDRVWSLAVFDDGTGAALYAGGEFADAGGSPAANLARWDGHSWSAVGSGVSGAVQALAVFDDEAVRGLYVGGWFQTAGGISSPNLARWTGCRPCYANCDASTTPPVLNVQDFTCFLNQFAAGSAYANCDASTTPPVLNISDYSCFLNRFAAGCG
jgi:hypothetical protein